MADFAQVVPKPLSGYKRYEDTDINIEYIGNWEIYTNSAYSGGCRHQCYDNIDAKVKFGFTGTKLIIVTTLYGGYSPSIEIKIDGIVKGTFSQAHGTTLNKAICYSIENLPNTYHSVELTRLVKGSYFADFIIDAIYIDENGLLQKYEEIKKYFLVESGNKIYNIKNETFNSVLQEIYLLQHLET